MQDILPGDLPAISLIICSRNRPKLLAETVESILRGEETPSEIIIIDQSETPHSELMDLTDTRGCEVRYIWSQSVGASRARNEGVAWSRHEILVFTDDDILATPTWFGALVRALINGGLLTAVSGRVLPTALPESGGFVPSTKISELPALYEGRVGEDVLWTNNLAIFRSAFDTIGGFDERLGPGTAFPAAEDNDFGFRLLEAGYRISYIPQAALYHRAWRPEKDYLPLRWSYGRGQGAFYAKYLSLRDRYMLGRFAHDIGQRILRFPMAIWRQRLQAYSDTVFIFGLVCGAGGWLLRQRKTR